MIGVPVVLVVTMLLFFAIVAAALAGVLTAQHLPSFADTAGRISALLTVLATFVWTARTVKSPSGSVTTVTVSQPPLASTGSVENKPPAETPQP